MTLKKFSGQLISVTYSAVMVLVFGVLGVSKVDACPCHQYVDGALEACGRKGNKEELKAKAIADAKARKHVKKMVEGWTVMVDSKYFTKEHKAKGEEALRVLKSQLYKITLVLPHRLADFRKVKIYMDMDHPLTALQYHPGVQWLKSKGYDPKLVKCVHIPQARRLVGLAKSNGQPWVMLHELAHAYHDQFLSFNDKSIIAAYQAAVKSKKYERVMHLRGHKTRHYALTNHKEYFAEMTESYIGMNDFYPFVKGELREYDAKSYELMRKIWGKKRR